jgi:hypothetical protein
MRSLSPEEKFPNLDRRLARMNMHNYWRRLLDQNLLEPGKDTMTALLEGGFRTR